MNRATFFIFVFYFLLALITSSFIFAPQTFAQATNSVTINTQDIVRNVSPAIYGLTNSPDPGWTDAWDKIEAVGVTMIRKDFNIESKVPNTNITDYKSNTNDVQNIATWNQTYLNNTRSIFSNARQHQMKTLGIVDYCPTWLSYSGTKMGVPKDWLVWEDLVKKSHNYYKNQLDAVEIWNEPNYSHFLDLSGSPYSTRAAAYIDIFKHTYNAIRSVDQNILIGGPAGYTYKDQDFLRAILSDQFVREHLDFVSVHFYPQSNPSQFNSTQDTRAVLNEYGMQDTPIAITEWNYTPSIADDRNTTPVGISFIGKNFLDFWRNGVISAHYYVGRPYTAPGVMAFYNWTNNIATPLPQTRAFQVASQSLSLGKGQAKLLNSSASGAVDGTGLINTNGHVVGFVVNDSTSSKPTTITFNQLPNNKTYHALTFLGSATNDGKQPYKTQLIKTTQNKLSLNESIPSTSVMGIVLIPNEQQACQADINQDSIVDISDYAILVFDFLKTNPNNPRADINSDGIVDISDYSLFTSSFFQRCEF